MRLRWLPIFLFVVGALAASCGTGHQSADMHAARASGSVSPMLGWNGFLAGQGGWGAVQPPRISNEGDDSSFVYQVNWRAWGGAVAYGFGRRHAFKPAGGNYRHGVLDELRASNLGLCHGKLAYRTLYTRQARRPGTKTLGKWQGWSRQRGLACGRFGDLNT